jgi:hypothetical protein
MTTQTYSSDYEDHRHDSCMSLVASSRGGFDCNCYDFNKEENKRFDNSGKPIAKFDVMYIGGHQAYPKGKDTQAFFFVDGFEINEPLISTTQPHYTRRGYGGEAHNKNRGVYDWHVERTTLEEKLSLYCIDYTDENEEETIVLDFHRSVEKAQGLIYQKMIATKNQSNHKSAKSYC